MELKLSTLFDFSKVLLLSSLMSTSLHAQPNTTYLPPIIVDANYIKTNGNIITGNYQGTATQAAITVSTTSPVTIANSNLKGPGNLIQATSGGANITVKNTQGFATNPNVKGAVKGIFLYVSSFTNINMQNNNITGARIGFYCSSYVGNKSSTNTLIIANNVFLNLDARPSNGNNGYISSGQYNGQAIHLGGITNVPGIDIGWNEIMNTAGQSATGAIIELNQTSGTSSSPINIHNNFISGAFPTLPGVDLYGFGAILVNGAANDTSTTASSFININNNRVVATANYGIAIEAGHDVSVNNNRVISSGFLPNGTTFYPMSTYGNAAGAVNINQYNQSSNVFFNNSVSNNVLGLIKNDGKSKPVRSDWNLPGQGGAVSGNTDYAPNDNTDPSVYAEAMEYSDWLQATHLNNMIIGTATVGYVPDLTTLTPMPPVNAGVGSTLVLDHVSITNPNGNCINASGGSQITVTNSVIGPCNGRGIVVSSTSSAIVQNNYVHDVVREAIVTQSNASQTIRYNTIQNAGFGIYVINNDNNVTQSNVDYNQINNIIGVTGKNSSAVQFNQVSGPNNTISCNVYYQPSPPPAGYTGTCDSFSLYLSSGTANSPVRIVGNRINGSGDFWNCGGIMLTDGDTGAGTTGPGYVYAGDNYLLNPGNYGIHVSTGHDVTIDNNFIYSDNYDFYDTSNNTYGPGRTGLSTFNVYSESCTNITVTNNTAFFLSSYGGVNNFTFHDTCSPVTQSNNIGYSQNQPFQFPSIYTPRSSC
ncbi:MAG: right-handed parallel beta-helix repeat-containing protein [Pseudomonadota bacterium]